MLLGCLAASGGATAKTAGPTGVILGAAFGPSLVRPPLRQTTRARAVDGWVAIATGLAPRAASVRTGLIALEVYDARDRRAGRRAFAGLILGRGATVRRSFWWPAPGTPTLSATPTATSTSTATPTAPASLGLAGPLGSADGGDNDNISTSPITSGPAGAVVNGLSAYINPPNPGDQIALAHYANGSGNLPGTLLVHSAKTTVSAGGWNTVSISPTTLAPNTVYWIAYNTNSGADNLHFTADGSGLETHSSAVTFGTWPTTIPGDSGNQATPGFLLTARVVGTPAPGPTATPSTPPPGPAASCQFGTANQPLSVAFCDSFDAPAGNGGRAGDLNPALWSVARIEAGGSGYGANLGQGAFDTWIPASLNFRGTHHTVVPDHDIQICGGHLVEGINEDHGQPVLAMQPKQPFDIAGRTGTVVFEVSDNTQGPHGAWPEVWYTDTAAAAPNDDGPSGINASPHDALGLQLNDTGSCAAGQVTVGLITQETNYVSNSLSFNQDGCVTLRSL